jgi:hypothetical protein
LAAISILKSVTKLADPQEESSRWQEQAYDLEMKLKYGKLNLTKKNSVR